MDAQVTIMGADELVKKLGMLGEAVQGKAVELAALKGAAHVALDANRRAPGPHIEVEVVREESTAGRAVVEIGPDEAHWYYQFAETGAGRHEISARTKKALYFEGDEGAMFAKRVKHPGRAARPFLRPAIEARQQEATHAASQELRKVIERYTK